MKKISWICIGLIFVAILLMVWRIQHSRISAPDKTVASATNSPILIAETKTPARQIPASNQTDDGSNMTDIAIRYKQGVINKGEAMLEILKGQNNQPQSFYGKTIDQNGNPIAGVEVTGNIVMMGGLGDNAKNQTYKTQSDSEGFFEFAEKRGWQLNVIVKKEGYLMGAHGEGYKGPRGKETTPDNRALLTLWKLRGPETLISSEIDAHISHDGTPVVFDMTSGKQSPNGDFRVVLSQYPLEVEKGWERFDWSIKMEILNGGLVEEDDAYPFWAPTDGYQPTFEFSESTNAVKWLGGLQKKFYIKTAQGQYGRMQFKIFPGRSPTGLQANFTINPSGSQNLEPANLDQ
jgi:hypothetical protein